MRLYMLAADVYKELEKGRNIKQVAFNKNLGKFLGPVYKICSEMMQNKALVNRIYQKVTEKGTVKNKNMMKVLIYELFLGAGKIKGGGALKRMLKSSKEEIETIFEKELSKSKASSLKRRNKGPMFIRHFYKGIEESEEELRGIIIENYLTEKNKSEDVDKWFKRDLIVADAIQIEHEVYSSLHRRNLLGNYIVQGFSSCLPPLVLSKVVQDKPFEDNDTIIDACSAPGNKTLQLIKYFKNCVIRATERDSERFKILGSRLEKYKHESNAQFEIENGDFTKLDPNSEKNSSVKAIMLDPTCSGTGMRNRSSQNKVEFSRLKVISDMQLKLIMHAARFPNLRYIVYSTCSVEKQENEFNVLRALKEIAEFRQVSLADIKEGYFKDVKGGERLKEGHIGGGLGEKFDSILKRSVRVEKSDSYDGFFVCVFILGKII